MSSGFSIEADSDVAARTNSFRARESGRSSAAISLHPLLESSSGEPRRPREGSAALSEQDEALAFDAIAARSERNLTGDVWDSGGGARRCGGHCAYYCCSAPAVYREEFRDSLPVERLHALIDALVPISATVMFVKYFTQVGEAQEEQEHHRCEAEAAPDADHSLSAHDDPCRGHCPEAELVLYAATAAVAAVVAILGGLCLWKANAPSAARELLLLSLPTLFVGLAFYASCKSGHGGHPMEPSFCLVIVVGSALCIGRAALRLLTNDERAEGGHREGEEGGGEGVSVAVSSVAKIVLCVIAGSAALADLVLYDGLLLDSDCIATREEDVCTWREIFTIMWVGRYAKFNKLRRLACTSLVFTAAYVDWAANVRLFRWVGEHGRISKAAYMIQCVWCGAVTLYPLTMAPWVMGEYLFLEFSLSLMR